LEKTVATKKTAAKYKKPQSFREQTEQKRKKASEPRRLRKTANTASKPVKAARSGIKKAFSPLSFILKPLQTAPMRKVGRILSKILLLGYLRASWQELRQVTWPNRRETIKLTTAVVVFALIFGLFITVIDYGLDKLFRFIIL